LALIVFTAAMIVRYFLIVGLSPNPLGIVDKLVELALIALLFVEMRQPAPRAAAPLVARRRLR
jgi:hypothetical protein